MLSPKTAVIILVLCMETFSTIYSSETRCSWKRIVCLNDTSYTFCFNTTESTFTYGKIKHCPEYTKCCEDEEILPCIKNNKLAEEIKKIKSTTEAIQTTIESALTFKPTIEPIPLGTLADEKSTDLFTYSTIYSLSNATTSTPKKILYYKQTSPSPIIMQTRRVFPLKKTKPTTTKKPKKSTGKRKRKPSVSNFKKYLLRLRNRIAKKKIKNKHLTKTVKYNNAAVNKKLSIYNEVKKTNIQKTTSSKINKKYNKASPKTKISVRTTTAKSKTQISPNKPIQNSTKLNKKIGVKTTSTISPIKKLHMYKLEQKPTLQQTPTKRITSFTQPTRRVHKPPMATLFLGNRLSTSPTQKPIELLDTITKSNIQNDFTTNKHLFDIVYPDLTAEATTTRTTTVNMDQQNKRLVNLLDLLEQSLNKRNSSLAELNLTNTTLATPTTQAFKKEAESTHLIKVVGSTHHPQSTLAESTENPCKQVLDWFQSSMITTSTSTELSTSTTERPSVCKAPAKYPTNNCNEYDECKRVMWWYRWMRLKCNKGFAFDAVTQSCQKNIFCV